MNLHRWASRHIFILAAALYSAVFIFFLPKFFDVSDSWWYFRQTQSFLGGGGLVEGNIYPIGQSVWLAPFAALPFPLVFLSGLAAILIGAYFFYLLLKRAGYDTKYFLLFLFFIPFLDSVRSLRSEAMLVTLVLAAFYFYTSPETKKRHWILAGALFGLAVLFKYPMVIVFGAFAFVCLLKKDFGKLGRMVAGAAPFAAAFFIINKLLYGGFLATGYGGAGVGYLDLALIPQQLPVFVLLLSIFYPLLFFAPFFYKKGGRAEICLALVALLVFYSATYWSGFTWRWTDLIVKIRYILPVVGLLLLSYVSFFERLCGRLRLPPKQIFAAAVGVLIILTVWGSAVHAGFTNDKAAVYEQIRDAIPPKNYVIVGTLDSYIYFSAGYQYFDMDDPQAFIELEQHGGYIIDLSYKNRASYTDTTTVLRNEKEAALRKLADGMAGALVYYAREPHDLYIFVIYPRREEIF